MCNVLIKYRICKFAYCMMVALCFSFFTSGKIYAATIVDGPIAREKFQRDVRDLLYQQKFDDLENLAKRLRVSKARFPEGHWQLMYFYRSLLKPPKGPIVQPIRKWKWDRHFALLEKWQKTYPDSVTSKVVTAKAWVEYGWEARGGGFASTVTEEGWKLLRERIKQAVSQIDTISPNPLEDCPERFNTLLELGKAEGMSRDKFMALFKAAVVFEPQYHSFYATTASYLSSRWHGDGNDWLDFIEKADAISGNPGDRELYARLAPGFWDAEWTNFSDQRVSWNKLKQGYLDMEKRFPNSPYNLNNFALYACMAGDLEVARDLLQKIGNAPYLKSWEEPFKQYDECRKITGIGGPMRADLKESQESIQVRILSKQGDKYSQYSVAMEYPQAWPSSDINAVKGMALIKASAEQGFAPAQVALAVRLWNSGRDKAEKEIALGWLERAALQDEDGAKYFLSRWYEEVPVRNLIKAYAWYSYSDDANSRQAITKLAKELTPEQLAEAKNETERIRKSIQAMP